MTYESIVSVYTVSGEPITALTDAGISEIKDMLAAARRSTKDWHDFLRDFVADPDIIARVKDQPLRQQPDDCEKGCGNSIFRRQQGSLPTVETLASS